VNLAVNARDAMPRGGKFILETRAERFDETFVDQHQNMPAGNYVLLAVSDTGTGMDEATVSRIFEPSSHQGTGQGNRLGLGYRLRHRQAKRRTHPRLQRTRTRHNL